jgi:uncharacterized protein (UPF0333 family)
VERGQTSIEYVLVLLTIVLVMFFALKNSELDNSIELGSHHIANTVDEAATK